MRYAKSVLLVACAFGLAAVPTCASAADSVAPPGNSGVDEYFETVPSADGNRPVRRRAKTSAVPSKAKRQLSQLGSDGQAAAGLAEATAPAAGVSPRKRSAHKSPRGPGEAAPRSGVASAEALPRPGSAVSAAARTASTDTASIALLVVLGILLVAAGVLSLRRRRRA